MDNHLLLADQRGSNNRDSSLSISTETAHNGSLIGDDSNPTPPTEDTDTQNSGNSPSENPIEERLNSLQKQLDIEMKVCD